MKDTLKPGLTATRRITIDKPRTIDFLGENLRVYATPELVRDFEIACREFLLAHCDPGEDSVGTMQNDAPFPYGALVPRDQLAEVVRMPVQAALDEVPVRFRRHHLAASRGFRSPQCSGASASRCDMDKRIIPDPVDLLYNPQGCQSRPLRGP